MGRLKILAFIAVAAALVCFAQDWMRTPDSAEGKHVIVCGASRGIGVEIARKYAQRGAKVVLVARNSTQLEELADELKQTHKTGEFYSLAVDLSAEEGVDTLVHRVKEDLGWQHVDVLCLNHVVAVYGHFLQQFQAGQDMSMISKAFNVNALSYIFLATKFLPSLIAGSKASGQKSQILVVSSLAGKIGVPLTTGYAGTKHALHGFFDSLRHDLVLERIDDKVHITTCVLGNINTEANRQVTAGFVNPLLVANPVDEAAEAIVRGGLLHRREIYYPWSECVPVICLHFFFPEWIDHLVRAMSLGEDAKKGKRGSSLLSRGEL